MDILQNNIVSTDYKNEGLTGNFMFQHVFDDERATKTFLEKSLRRDVGKITFLHSEMTQTVSISSKDTRFDILACDSSNNLYDIEMENRYNSNLSKRASYYADILGVKNLKVGEDFEKLPHRTIIFITNFDPFGLDRSMYTIKPRCIEEPDFELESDWEIIFLNLKGTIGFEALEPEIQDFVKLARNTTKETADASKTPYGGYLYQRVEMIRNEKELEGAFMSLQSNYRQDMEQSKMQGKIEGVDDTLKVVELYKENESVNKISEITGMSEENIDRIIRTFKN